MRNISFMLTLRQFEDGSKDVTRRMGWLNLKAGDILCAVEKGQGLKPGEKIKRLGYIRVIFVSRQRLNDIVKFPEYGELECDREGFPLMKPAEFVAFFCRSHKGCTPNTDITRISFVKVEKPDA